MPSQSKAEVAGPPIFALGGTANHSVTGRMRSHCAAPGHGLKPQGLQKHTLNPSWYLCPYHSGSSLKTETLPGVWVCIFYVDIFITENLIKLVLPVNLIANFIESKKRTLSSHVGETYHCWDCRNEGKRLELAALSKLREGSLPRWNGSVSRKDSRQVLLILSLEEGFPVGLGLSSPGSGAPASQKVQRGWLWHCREYIAWVNPRAATRSCHWWGDTAGNAACESQGCYKKELPLPGQRSMTGAMPSAMKYLSAPLLPHTGRAF